MDPLFYSEPHVPPCRSVNEVPLQAQRLKTSTLWHWTFGCVLVTIVSQNLGGYPNLIGFSWFSWMLQLVFTWNRRCTLSDIVFCSVRRVYAWPRAILPVLSSNAFCFIQWHMYGFQPRCCRLPPSALMFWMIWHGDDFSNLRNAIGIFPSKPAAHAKPWRIEGERS
jgi:hypothetical protein